MAFQICNRITEDFSDSCHSYYNDKKDDLADLKERNIRQCRQLCSCGWQPWKWPCCVLRAGCIVAVWISHGVALVALLAIYLGCLATALVTTLVCHVVTFIAGIFFEAVEVFFTKVLEILRPFVGIWCDSAVVSNGNFEFSTLNLEGSQSGIPENSAEGIFVNRSSSPVGLRIQYLGTNSIHISDGETDLLIDPYFTRPDIPKAKMAFCGNITIQSNREIVRQVLTGANITKVDAILMTHAHYDHALDIAEVAEYVAEQNNEVYPKIIGSKSIFHVCRGAGIPESHLVVVDKDNPDSESFSFGRFEEITFLKGKHLPIPVVGSFIGGSISSDLTQPANLFDFKEGGTFAIFIDHKWGRIVNIGSANCRKGSFDTLKDIDYLILGIAGFDNVAIRLFDNFNLDYRDSFYAETVKKLDPDCIFFSHWDDFNRQLDEDYPKWIGDPKDSREFFVSKNPDIPAKFLPIGGYVDLENL